MVSGLSSHAPSRRSLVVVAFSLLLGAAALVRLHDVVVPALDEDEQWVGVEAVNVLKGVFPPFIYGTPYQGSLGLFLHGAAVAVAGATPWVLKVVPLLYSLLLVALTFVLARRLFDRETASVAALVAAFLGAPFLSWSVNARYYYSLVPVLGSLLLLLGLAAWRDPGRRGRARWFVFGFVSGITLWVNYTGVIYPAALAMLLLVTDFRRTLAAGLRSVLPGFLLGTAPLWIYNLQARVLFVVPAGDRMWGDWHSYLLHVRPTLQAILGNAMGVAFPQRPWTPIEALHAVLAAGFFLIGLAATILRARRDRARALIPLVFVCLVGPVVASVFGADPHDRYLFPLFTVIPLIVGAAFALIRRGSRILAWGLLTVLIVPNVWAGVRTLPTMPAGVHRLLGVRALDQRLFQKLTSLRLRAVYSKQYVLGFASGGTVTVSNSWEDWNILAAESVDSSSTVAFAHDARFGDLEAGLAALNTRYQVERVGRWWVYHGLMRPAVAFQEIPPDRWSARADDNSEQANLAFDRDMESDWHGSQWPGRRYTLDLGRPETVAMVAWLPRVYHESPSGIEVEVSLDGATWGQVARVPDYGIPVYWSGMHPFLRLRRPRVEVQFAPALARFIRVGPLRENARFDWSMRELFVYRLAPTAAAPDPGSIDQVAALLSHRSVSGIYGDHWVLARLHAVSSGALRTLPVNIFTDLHGRTDLYRQYLIVPEYDHPDRFQPRWRTFVVLQQSSGTTLAFETLLREGGYAFRQETVGDYGVYSEFVGAPPLGRPLSHAGWAAWASAAGETAGRAVDDDPESRWSSGRPQRPGDWFALDLGRAERIGAMELDTRHAVHEAARRLELTVSVDGTRWVRLDPVIVRKGPLAWGGTHALRRGVSATQLTFPAVLARFVTLTQTADHSDPWTIQDLRVYPAGRPAAADGGRE